MRKQGATINDIVRALGDPADTINLWVAGTVRGKRRPTKDEGSTMHCPNGHRLHRYNFITDGAGRVICICDACENGKH